MALEHLTHKQTLKTELLKKFNLVVTPGFEILAQDELIDKWNALKKTNTQLTDLLNIEKHHGRIEFFYNNFAPFELNKVLKIPTRITLTLLEFKCRDFPKLYKKISTYSWGNFLVGQTPILRVISQKSRLIHTNRIEETTLEALAKYYQGFPPKKTLKEKISTMPPTRLIIKFIDDLCTVSIDTSGEPLYKRNLNKNIHVAAPLRENIASAILYKLVKNISDLTDIQLIDPMCGSGTFLSEAYNLNSIQNTRSFSYQFFPIFSKETSLSIPDQKQSSTFSNYIGIEREKNIAEEIAKNHPELEIFCGDSLKDNFPIAPKKNILVCNLPYGKRLAINNPHAFYQHTISSFINNFNPYLIALLYPQTVRVKCPVHYRQIEDLNFKNGGFPVHLHILKKV